MEQTKASNYLEDIDKIFGNLYLSMKDFSRHDWNEFTEVGYESLDFEINKVLKEKVTVMFIPTPTKEGLYSTFQQVKGNPFKIVEKMKFIISGVLLSELQGLLTLNMTGKGGDIVVLLPNPRGETADVYIIPKEYLTQGEIKAGVEKVL